MHAVDTNVVVRYLTGDHPEQSARARALIDGQDVFVGTTVLLETEWVLRSVYGLPVARLCQGLRAFAGLARVSVENPVQLAEALDLAERGMDFADALHLGAASHCEAMMTFDRGFAKTAKALHAGPAQGVFDLGLGPLRAPKPRENPREGAPRVELFFALHPDPGAIARINGIRNDICARWPVTGDPVPDPRLHVTLLSIGLFSEERVATATRLAAAIAAPPFEIAFDHVVSFRGAGALVLGGEKASLAGVRHLRGLLAAGLGMRGSFTPHLTLLYGRHALPATPVPRIAWMAREFALVSSFVGQGRHETIDRWALTG